MLCSGGDVPGLGGDVPGPGGCTWSRGVYLVQGGVPGPGGCAWSWGGVPGPGGCTWSGGGGLHLVGRYLVRYSPPVNRMNDRQV